MVEMNWVQECMPNKYITRITPSSKTQEHRRVDRLQKIRGPGSLPWDCVFQIWLHKQDFNNDTGNRYASMEVEKSHYPTGNQWCRRDNWSLPGMCPLIGYLIQSCWFPNHIYTNEKNRLTILYVYIYTHVWRFVCSNSKEKEANNLSRRVGKDIWKVDGEEREGVKWYNYILIKIYSPTLKINKNIY